jgi:hypothetical protein
MTALAVRLLAGSVGYQELAVAQQLALFWLSFPPPHAGSWPYLGLRPSAPGFFLFSFHLLFLSTISGLVSLRLCSSTFEFGFVWRSED